MATGTNGIATYANANLLRPGTYVESVTDTDYTYNSQQQISFPITNTYSIFYIAGEFLPVNGTALYKQIVLDHDCTVTVQYKFLTLEAIITSGGSTSAHSILSSNTLFTGVLDFGVTSSSSSNTFYYHQTVNALGYSPLDTISVSFYVPAGTWYFRIKVDEDNGYFGATQIYDNTDTTQITSNIASTIYANEYVYLYSTYTTDTGVDSNECITTTDALSYFLLPSDYTSTKCVKFEDLRPKGPTASVKISGWPSALSTTSTAYYGLYGTYQGTSKIIVAKAQLNRGLGLTYAIGTTHSISYNTTEYNSVKTLSASGATLLYAIVSVTLPYIYILNTTISSGNGTPTSQSIKIPYTIITTDYAGATKTAITGTISGSRTFYATTSGGSYYNYYANQTTLSSTSGNFYPTNDPTPLYTINFGTPTVTFNISSTSATSTLGLWEDEESI